MCWGNGTGSQLPARRTSPAFSRKAQRACDCRHAFISSPCSLWSSIWKPCFFLLGPSRRAKSAGQVIGKLPFSSECSSQHSSISGGWVRSIGTRNGQPVDNGGEPHAMVLDKTRHYGARGSRGARAVRTNRTPQRHPVAPGGSGCVEP